MIIIMIANNGPKKNVGKNVVDHIYHISEKGTTHTASRIEVMMILPSQASLSRVE